MSTQQIGVRLPNELVERLDARAKEKGVTRTDIITELLESGLGVKHVKDDRLSLLESKLNEIELSLEALSSALPKPKNDRFSVVRSLPPPRENGLERTRNDSTASDAPACPKCPHKPMRREGRGKRRKDGTRSQRWKCKECGAMIST